MEAALKVIAGVATDALAAIAQQGLDFPLLLVDLNGSGQLFSCEISLVQKRHPELGWSYLVGLQRNAAVPVMQVLEAAIRGRDSYTTLCRNSCSALPDRSGWAEQVDDHCHAVMTHVWRAALSQKIADTSCKTKIQERFMQLLLNVIKS